MRGFRWTRMVAVQHGESSCCGRRTCGRPTIGEPSEGRESIMGTMNVSRRDLLKFGGIGALGLAGATALARCV